MKAMPLTFVIDNYRQVDTLPRSFSRLRPVPGQHRIHFEWDGDTQCLFSRRSRLGAFRRNHRGECRVGRKLPIGNSRDTAGEQPRAI